MNKMFVYGFFHVQTTGVNINVIDLTKYEFYNGYEYIRGFII